MIELKLHNLILTVGPSMCGKSYWAETVKAQINKDYPKLNVQVISSDAIRRELIGFDADRHDQKMWYASNPAFQLLNAKVAALMQWPVAAEIIIVDSTALQADFRQEMVNLAKANNYLTSAVVFNYPEREDYLQFGGGTVTQKHINRLKYVWRDLKIFDSVYQIKSPFEDYTLRIPDYNYYNSHFLKDDDYYVIGDVHGQIEALKEVPTDKPHIYLGDIVDNGTPEDIKATIDYVHKRVQQLGARFIIGNHDDWCVQYWAGSKSHTKEIAEQHFQSALNLDSESKAKLTYLVHYGRYFYRTPNMIITHAPCKEKHLGKLHALKQQKVIRYPRLAEYADEFEWQEALYARFNFLDDPSKTKPLHVWGHVALQRPFRRGANLGIDTGAFTGNGLTYYDGKLGRYSFIKSKAARSMALIQNLIKPKPRQTFDTIDGRMKGRIMWMAENGVNFVSGTMTPADKQADELESLAWGLEYYLDKYGSVTIQPKYMGSRGQVYLFNDPTKCYVITRNGYRYGHRENADGSYNNELLYPEYERLIERFESEFEAGLKLRILDAEILPWRLLGEGLIDKDFYSYGRLLKAQTEAVLTGGLEAWETYFTNTKVIRDGEALSFDVATKKEVIEQHGHHIWSTYLAYKDLRLPKLSDVDAFLAQVDLFGGNSDPEIKPFSILKDVFDDDTEELYLNASNEEMWYVINDDHIITTDDFNSAFEYYQHITETYRLEGVVLKPPTQQVDGNLPYIKVRNAEYLRMVYGPSYKLYLEKLIARKSIRNKIKASLIEWSSGWQMLSVPYSELTTDNDDLLQLYLNHITEDFGVIDPRL